MAKLCIQTAAILVGIVLIVHSKVKCEESSNNEGMLCVNAESDGGVSTRRCRPSEPEEQIDADDVVEYRKEDKLPGTSDEGDQMVCTQMNKIIYIF